MRRGRADSLGQLADGSDRNSETEGHRRTFVWEVVGSVLLVAGTLMALLSPLWLGVARWVVPEIVKIVNVKWSDDASRTGVLREMLVDARNSGERPLRVAAIVLNRSNYVAWRIEGSNELSPKAVRRLALVADAPDLFIPPDARSFQLVLSEPGRDRIVASSGILPIPPVEAVIINPRLDFWSRALGAQWTVPYGWAVIERGKSSLLQVLREELRGQGVAVLRALQDRSQEWQHIGLVQRVRRRLRELEVVAFPTFESARGAAEFGIRISEGVPGRHLVVLFGKEQPEGPIRNALPGGVDETVVYVPSQPYSWASARVELEKWWPGEIPDGLFVELYLAVHRSRPGEFWGGIRYVVGR